MMKAAVYGTAAFMHKNMIFHINVLQSNEDMTVKLAWTSKNDCVTMHTMHCNERRVSGGPELRKLIVFLAALLFLLPAWRILLSYSLKQVRVHYIMSI